MLLHGIKDVLSNNRPVRGNRFGISLGRTFAFTVGIKLAPQIKNARSARRKRWLRIKEIGLHSFDHLLTD